MLLGLASITWGAHQFHIALPSYIYSSTILTGSLGRIDLLVNYASTYASIYPLALSCTHHVSIGVILLSVALVSNSTILDKSMRIDFQQHILTGWHTQLSIYLAILGSLSIASAHSLSLSLYPDLSSSYPTYVSIFCHHTWIGCLLILESSAHTSIQLVKGSTSMCHAPTLILQHHHTLLTHLIWLNISLRSHSLTLYIHNNTSNTLGRAEDIFHDNSIRLYPSPNLLSSCNPSIRPNPLSTSTTLSLGTSDFLVNHIHAFSLHLTVLIVLKGILHSRTSRLISDKLDLGFRYPCDGPSRGGTCQVSPWDHLFLSLSWMYNLTSILLFHYFWKMQSDI